MKSQFKWVCIIVLCIMFISMQAFVVKDVKAESDAPDLEKDYVFTPVKPCRIVDTRLAGGAFVPGETRDFNVYGSVASQGGDPNCPSPKGEPRGVHLNVTVVPVSGQGNFRVFPANETATEHKSDKLQDGCPKHCQRRKCQNVLRNWLRRDRNHKQQWHCPSNNRRYGILSRDARIDLCQLTRIIGFALKLRFLQWIA